jgi:hypothetical protein
MSTSDQILAGVEGRPYLNLNHEMIGFTQKLRYKQPVVWSFGVFSSV